MWQNSISAIQESESWLANGSGNPLEISSSYSMDFLPQQKDMKSLSKTANSPLQPQLGNINLPNNFNAGRTEI